MFYFLNKQHVFNKYIHYERDIAHLFTNKGLTLCRKWVIISTF